MNIGFIGAGEMGGAMIEGLLKAEVISSSQLIVKGGKNGTAEKLQKTLGFQLAESYEAFKKCKVVFIATGASIVLDVLKELAPYFAKDSILISVAAGHSIQEAQEALGADRYVVHAIPNTPVSVNEGMIGAVYSENMPQAEKQIAQDLLKSLGQVIEVPEELLGTVGTVAGCSPAFVAIFMEALGDAGVMAGLPRAVSYQIVAQMVLGTARLAIESGKHPAELKDGVTSPGGSTIKGVAALEKHGFRYAVIDAVKQANS